MANADGFYEFVGFLGAMFGFALLLSAVYLGILVYIGMRAARRNELSRFACIVGAIVSGVLASRLIAALQIWTFDFLPNIDPQAQLGLEQVRWIAITHLAGFFVLGIVVPGVSAHCGANWFGRLVKSGGARLRRPAGNSHYA